MAFALSVRVGGEDGGEVERGIICGRAGREI